MAFSQQNVCQQGQTLQRNGSDLTHEISVAGGKRWFCESGRRVCVTEGICLNEIPGESQESFPCRVFVTHKETTKTK